jgi:hypothetical protein
VKPTHLRTGLELELARFRRRVQLRRGQLPTEQLSDDQLLSLVTRYVHGARLPLWVRALRKRGQSVSPVEYQS